MFSVYKIFLTLFFVAEVVLCNVVINSSIKNYNLTFALSSKQKYSREIAWKDNSFMTISCVDRDCTVKIETPKTLWDSKQKTIESFQFKLQGMTQSEEELFYIEDVLPLYRLDRTRAVVSWSEIAHSDRDKLKAKFMVVDVEKKTTSPIVALDAGDISHYYLLQIIVNRDTFTLFTMERDADDWSIVCRITYNFDNQRVGDVICSKRLFPEFFFTLPDSKAIKLTATDNLMAIDARRSNDEHVLFKSNDKITVCNFHPSDFNCTQFNDTRALFNVKIDLEFNHHTIGIYNLREGGLILATLDYTGDECGKFYVARVDENGNVYKSTTVTNYNTKCVFDMAHLIVNVGENGDDFCIYSTCRLGEFNDIDTYSFNAQCFEKSRLGL